MENFCNLFSFFELKQGNLHPIKFFVPLLLKLSTNISPMVRESVHECHPSHSCTDSLMSYIAIIPFCVLFASFAILRIELMYSAFLALLSCVAVAGASTDALQHTLVFLFEIGLIIFGAFYFIEVAEHKGVIHSLADLVKEVSTNRIVQSILVCFPLTLIVEGSSGFGTPLLIIAPLLRALGLPLILCAVLPLINMANGISFGALGTPIRLGFSAAANAAPIAALTIRAIYPFFWITPLISFFLLRKKIQPHDSEKWPIWILWTIFLSTIYGLTAFTVAEYNPEFPTLTAALLTFVIGIFSAHFIEHHKIIVPHHRKGLFIYTLLLTILWLGKQIWMDQKIPGTSLRIFNPGWIFIIFGLVLSKSGDFFMPAINRARRTLAILFCMTFIVQQLKFSGAMERLLANIPLWFLHSGTPLLAWLGSVFIGTATVANLFLSPLLEPAYYGVLAAGTALGVPLAFQMIVGVKSILKDEVSEREILKYIFPISVIFLTFTLLLFQLTH